MAFGGVESVCGTGVQRVRSTGREREEGREGARNWIKKALDWIKSDIGGVESNLELTD